jgi:hypothetical protein
VQTTLVETKERAAHVSFETSEGRSLKSVSPFTSCPVVMLKGRPELTVMKGLRRMPHGRALMAPPRKRRWRMSCAERPYSPVRSYWLAGKLPAPSVSLRARFQT